MNGEKTSFEFPVCKDVANRVGACAQRPIVHHARVGIELETAMHIGSDSDEGDSDAGIVFDANGLAAIPGSSIRGVLRHAYEAYRLSDRGKRMHPNLPPAADVFGSQADDADSKRSGGRLAVSWAHVHDCQNVPVDRPLRREEIIDDPVLRLASSPELRDHVRINRLGTAADRGKFDELAAAPGLRFTFSLEMRSGVDQDNSVLDADQDAWDVLLLILVSPLLRFGGKGRRGLGAFKVISHDHRIYRLDGLGAFTDRWDLLEERVPASEWDLYLALPASLSEPLSIAEGCGFHDKTNWLDATDELSIPGKAAKTYRCTLCPEPETYWMFGGGNQTGSSDSTPVSVRRVAWSERTGSGVVRDSYLIPGSAIKGTLRHRIAFHFRRLSSEWNDGTSPLTDELPAPIEELFGSVQEPAGSASGFTNPGDAARPGRCYISDLWIDPGSAGVQSAPLQSHVAIDRVTGGAMDHLLFDDQPLSRGKFSFAIQIANEEPLDPRAFLALELALHDLCQGRLALGAHSGRGYGYFTGKWELEQNAPREEADSEPEQASNHE